MKTYFKNINLITYLGLIATIGLGTVSCKSLNTNYYDTDGIYNSGKRKAPVTHNETAYYEEYFNEKKEISYETFTDIENYSSYDNGYYPGWGENNANTNIYINNGYGNPYWSWNNFYPNYGWNFSFGYNNYWGWNSGFGFGGYYGWGNPYFGGGWGYPYYGNGWGYPYYGYNTRNVSYSNNTRTIANTNRGQNSLNTRSNSNLTRSSRVAIENSRSSANRLDPRSNTNIQYRNANLSDLRKPSTTSPSINNETRTNTRINNNSLPSRNSNIYNTPTRTNSSPSRIGTSGSGVRTSTGRR